MPVSTQPLSPHTRRASLEAFESGRPLDILVVGGGVVGAGAALDAASRGLRTGLVEGRDWASGTSSQSSKLIHGGLRYLEMLDFGLVHEALRERDLLMNRLAPHLVRPVSFLYPLRRRLWERFYVGSGVALYDAMATVSARSGRPPRHRHLSRRGALALAPALREDCLVGGVRYFDAQVDDARHTMTLARTAVSHGALATNRTKVTGFLRDGEKVTGAELLDFETGRQLTVRARHVINATGVWTDDTQALAGGDHEPRVRASKGVHLVIPRDRIASASGLILRTRLSVLFVIPWDQHWIVGTTDTPWTLDKERPSATEADVAYLLHEVNTVLATPLGRDDVTAVYAGLRPLLSGSAQETAKLSREHSVTQPVPGLTVVAGGKYTTYRVMAKDAVDTAVAQMGQPVPPSRTAEIPLVGADGFTGLWAERHLLQDRWRLPLPTVEHLLRRHGALASEVAALASRDPELARPLAPQSQYLAAEVVHAVTAEGALRVEDVLARRTRMAMESSDGGASLADDVSRLMAPLLGWSEVRQLDEARAYREQATCALRVEADDDQVLVDR